MAKKQYETFVIERDVAASREALWDALLSLLARDGYATEGQPAPHGPGAIKHLTVGDHKLVERTLSLEPPWRRVYEIIEGAPVAFYQGTTVIVQRPQDGDGCLLAWSVLYDPLPDGTSDEFIYLARTFLEMVVDALIESVEGAR